MFYSPHGGVYFRDAASRDSSRPQPAAQFRAQPSQTMRHLSGGPLGNRMCLNPQPQAAAPGPPTAPTRSIGDAHAIRLLDTAMRDDAGPKTAVVIVQAETAIQHFEDGRTLAGRLGEWF